MSVLTNRHILIFLQNNLQDFITGQQPSEHEQELHLIGNIFLVKTYCCDLIFTHFTHKDIRTGYQGTYTLVSVIIN